MKAYAKETFENGFILREEDIVKLNDICNKRIIEANCSAPIIYKIYRADSFLFETTNHLEVTKEENSERNLIQKIVIECKDSNLDFKLEFDSSHNTIISIESDNRDLAFLLFSDIKSYISTEVAKTRSSKFKNILNFKNMYILGMFAFMIWLTYSIPKLNVSNNLIQSTKNSNDINLKLNMLIDFYTSKQNMPSIWKFILPMTVVVLFLAMLGPILDKLFPINLFCWGKAAIKYEKLVSFREKLIWGVCIALVVGIASSYFVFWSTK